MNRFPRSLFFGFSALLPLSMVHFFVGSEQGFSNLDPAQQEPVKTQQEIICAELAQQGVHLDLKRGLIELDAEICQDREPLEYLLVTENGKDHESLVKCLGVSAEALNTAILLLGVNQGKNVEYEEVVPAPTREEFEAGASLYNVKPPEGDGFYLYVAWQGVDSDGNPEQFFFRAEDLVVNVAEDRLYQRNKWVYLGSRFIKPHKDAQEFFAAEGEGNLVSICYFNPANQLLTGRDLQADNQYIWYPNMFLLPEIGQRVQFLFSLKKLEAAPPSVSSQAAAASK